jgi:hypothetical protein
VTTASVRTPAHTRDRTLVERLVAVFPLLLLVLVVLVFYGVEAWSRKTPWIFTDELEWTQISRSIAATGHAARRGQPLYFKSIYAYLIAPFWWIHKTAAAYAAIKYANAVIMTLAAVPTYLLARMLVTRRAAIAVAVGSIAVPAMAYATSIVSDVLAYPYFALCSWLSVRAFRSGRRRDLVLAAVFCVCGYFVRQRQFTTLPLSFAVAAFGLWLTGARGRALRRTWSRADTVGAVVLALGVAFLFNRVVLQHIQQWQVPSQYYKNRIVDLGLRAGLSLTIGLGVLPVIGGLVSLRLPDRRGDRTYRAYVAWTAAAIATLSIYAADKAAALSLNFATLWEERDLIYLSPLLLLGTAMVFEARRLDWRVVGAATAFVVVMVAFKAIQLGFPYYEAPGSAFAAALAYYSHWTTHDIRLLLAGIIVLSLGLIALRRRRFAAPLAVALLLGWMLAGEISMTVGLDMVANDFIHNLPAQLDWVDAHVHGQPVTYLGQAVIDPNGENLTEFWNRSIKHVTSLDGTAPGPGPTSTPLLSDPTGLLTRTTGNHYVLADIGVVLDGQIVTKEGDMTLYRMPGPWHLLDAVQQVYPDSWCPDWCSFTYFKPHQSGKLIIHIGRQGYDGAGEPGRAKVVIGAVRVDQNHAPQLGRIEHVIHELVRNGQPGELVVPVAQTPVRVEISIPNPLQPAQTGDPRQLGAQVGFTFVPSKRR